MTSEAGEESGETVPGIVFNDHGLLRDADSYCLQKVFVEPWKGSVR